MSRHDSLNSRLFAVLACSLDAVITSNSDGRIIDFNPAAEDMFGAPASEMSGKDLASTLFPQECRERYLNNLLRHLDADECEKLDRSSEMQAQRSDGELFDIELALHANEPGDDAGNVTVFIRDLTERRQAVATEQTLSDVRHESGVSQAKFQALFDQSQYMAAVLDLNGNLTDVNQKALVECGYRFKDVVNRPFWDTPWWRGSDEGRETLRKAVAVAAKGGTFKAELSYWLSDGSERTTDLTMMPVENEAGDVIYIVPTGIDITDRKLADQREQHHAKIQRFLDDTTVAANSSLDYETTLETVTHLCVPMLADWAYLDLLTDENEVKRVAVAYPDPACRELAARLAKFPAPRTNLNHPSARGLFKGESLLIEDVTEEILLSAVNSDAHLQIGREIAPVSLVTVPLVTRGEPLGALTLLMTTSGRRHDQESLRIAGEVARRAAFAVENARMYQIGLQANAAKSEFVANVSHEIRTPMTAIMGYVDLLLADEREEQKTEFLQRIHRNGHFLLNIINDILDVSKIEAGQIETVRERLSVPKTVADVYSMMQLRAAEKRLSLDVEYEHAIPEFIYTDQKRLRQILVNLVGNAVKFTHAGSVKLVVKYVLEQNLKKIRFDIVDTGIGMTAKQQSRLFKPFSQGSERITRAFGGTGLGLAISQRLAGLLGGEILVASEFGQGSRFSCVIPAGDVDESTFIMPQLHLTESLQSAEKSAANHVFSCTMLIVEDQPDVRELLQLILEPTGAVLRFAGNGALAVKEVANAMTAGDSIDLVLMDMRMPELDGYQTAARLRSMGFRQPIIAVTADAMHGDIDRCFAVGCDSYLSKPINTGELFTTIDLLLHQSDTDTLERSRRGKALGVLKQTRPRRPGPGTPAVQPRKVLLVDDGIDACLAIQKLLQRQGFEVEIAHDGESAIKSGAVFTPDIVLLDISLPDMDGFSVLKQCQQIHALRDTRFIAFTGHADSESQQEFVRAGFNQVVLKPVDVTKLVAILNADLS